MIKSLSNSVKYIGVDDLDLDLFESQYIVPDGMAYNSYLITDAKIAILDTADARKDYEWKSNLAEALEGRTPDETALRFAGCATGFRDTSRIASSNPAMWREIVENNRPAVLNAMRGFDRFYEEFRTIIESGDFDRFEALFAEGKRLRDRWTAYKEKGR